jgi:1-acyl-sn-glycerol-3-phosphate acyltransferase
MIQVNPRIHPKPASDAVYYFVRSVFNAVFRTLINVEIVGREHIPASGGYIVTTNHLSFFDSILVFSLMPRRMTAFGADKWRRTPIISHVCEMLGIIWVARGEADAEAIKATLAVLKNGGRLGMAPEGTRSKTGGLQAGKSGAVYFADRSKVPLLPVGQAGTDKVIASWKRLRRPRVRVTFGPLYVVPSTGRAKGPQLEAFTEELMCRIAALLPPEYRGVYANHPRLAALLAAPGTPPPARSADPATDPQPAA